MITSFADKQTERIWQGERVRRLPANIQELARRKLRMINNAHGLHDLTIPPSNRLEKLKGNRKDQFSIRINSQWRICFRWDGNAHEVAIVDYH